MFLTKNKFKAFNCNKKQHYSIFAKKFLWEQLKLKIFEFMPIMAV